MPVTRDQAIAIAHLAAAARPHGARQWDINGIVAAIHRVAHLALADVTAAAMRAATDRTLQTPAAISDTRSSAWRERLVEPEPTTPAKHVCPVHMTQFHGPVCPSCRADEIAGDPPPSRSAPVDPAPRAARIRESIHQQRECL